MTLRVEFSLTAEEDMQAIHEWIDDTETAVAYLRRIRAQCDRLAVFPDRGTRHKELGGKLRTMSFERRAVIAYVVDEDAVQVLRILHKGRNVDRALRS